MTEHKLTFSNLCECFQFVLSCQKIIENNMHQSFIYSDVLIDKTYCFEKSKRYLDHHRGKNDFQNFFISVSKNSAVKLPSDPGRLT